MSTATVDLTRRAESTPELTLVHGLCEAWIAHFRRVCGSRPSFGKWDWGGSARPMWFVGHPRVNFGRWPGKFLGCRIISVCVTPAKPRLRPKMKAAKHVVPHFGSRLIATAWDLVVMVLRLRLLGTPQMFVRCPSNLYRRLRMRQQNPLCPQRCSILEHQPSSDVSCLPLAGVRMLCIGWLGPWFWGCWGCWCCKN